MNNFIKTHLLVVKVGTNTLVDTSSKSQRLDRATFASIGEQITQLSSKTTGVVLVSSGAITAGLVGEGKDRCAVDDERELQRYAMRGWGAVVRQWQSAIGRGQITSALLTKHELHQQTTRRKIIGAVSCCLAHGDIFLTNENDAICDDEIKFGDNDILAAELAATLARSGLFGTVKLVLLTTVDGLYADPDDNRTVIRTVADIAAVRDCAGQAASAHSRGGMVSKLLAAEIAQAAGAETFIANGRASNAIARALSGKCGTRFTVSGR
jgi:glutamate 5-kinase